MVRFKLHEKKDYQIYIRIYKKGTMVMLLRNGNVHVDVFPFFFSFPFDNIGEFCTIIIF